MAGANCRIERDRGPLVHIDITKLVTSEDEALLAQRRLGDELGFEGRQDGSALWSSVGHNVPGFSGDVDAIEADVALESHKDGAGMLVDVQSEDLGVVGLSSTLELDRGNGEMRQVGIVICKSEAGPDVNRAASSNRDENLLQPFTGNLDTRIFTSIGGPYEVVDVPNLDRTIYAS